MSDQRFPAVPLLLVVIFGVAFAFVEAAVVVYLRSLYYPDGFAFPLRRMPYDHLVIELFRETSTLIMLAAVAALAGKQRWERFGYFLIAFGIWDLFYYVWLKVLIDWPSTIVDWDILFLLPVPWIGPVLAPSLISLMMIVCGFLILFRISRNRPFDPPLLSWLLACGGTMILLYSFVADLHATLGGAMPAPYKYWMLFPGLLLGAAAFAGAWMHHVPDRKR